MALRKAVWSGINGIGLGTGRMGIECCRFRAHVLDADTAEVALRSGRRRIMVVVVVRFNHQLLAILGLTGDGLRVESTDGDMWQDCGCNAPTMSIMESLRPA